MRAAPRKIFWPFDTSPKKMPTDSAPLIAKVRIAEWLFADVLDCPRNPRTHPAPGSPKWKAAETSLGNAYFDPMVINVRNRMLISGHFRRKVMQGMGFAGADMSEVDVDEETHWAMMIAANNLLGEWEEDILKGLAQDLESAGISAGLAGWTEKELASMLQPPEITDDTEETLVMVSQPEEFQRQWQVKLGDFYAVGHHRLICGECENPENWRAMLGDRLADMVWTDPPYNVDYDETQQRRIAIKAAEGQVTHTKPHAILNDSLPHAEYVAKLNVWLQTAADFTKEGGAIYVAHADSYGLATRLAFENAGFHLAQCLIWVKNTFTLGRQDHQWQHEPVLYGWKPGAGHYWQGGYRQTSVIDDETRIDKLDKKALVAIINDLRNERNATVIREPRNHGNGMHPTVKPLPLVARQVWNSSRRGETVLELFGGSGTTMMACEETERRCVCTELDPKFAAVILERAKRKGLTIEKLRDGPAA